MAKGPRAEKAIFDATLRLLTERGYDGLTVEGVADLAGVNKTTLYRWWPSKPALVRAALLRADVLTVEIPDTGSLRGDLIALVEGMIGLLGGQGAGGVAAAVLASAGRDETLAALSRDFFADRLERERPIFDRAVERGELSDATGVMTLMDLLAGAVWLRLVLRGLPAPPRFAEELVDTVLPGHAVRH
ncbi:TetR/AcrR family transcriptional regulator [Bailinhaonella thermotolerans]|uniref:TetR/AcrR family transcriptional regulator n=1 Tax=Bailinhaonella thermotolerans TaxID=1070861 RepID=A0A3A4B0P5_9ACTN|nr:TetR/AcrR family transcriptional regulator [Bailinhaonella thermotolerans]RJL25182.1 TetR/AcrR family transcriptional regulator [Bailinhaonella thermotolerans]